MTEDKPIYEAHDQSAFPPLLKKLYQDRALTQETYKRQPNQVTYQGQLDADEAIESYLESRERIAAQFTAAIIKSSKRHTILTAAGGTADSGEDSVSGRLLAGYLIEAITAAELLLEKLAHRT